MGRKIIVTELGCGDEDVYNKLTAMPKFAPVASFDADENIELKKMWLRRYINEHLQFYESKKKDSPLNSDSV